MFEVIDTGLRHPSRKAPHIFSLHHGPAAAHIRAALGLGLAIALRRWSCWAGSWSWIQSAASVSDSTSP